MLELGIGRVTELLSQREGVTEVLLEIDHPIKKAVNYDSITGSISVGDWLYLNTTAGTLSLGTGGFHFVMANTSCNHHPIIPGGHGMKVRYTPFQVKVPFIEEECSEKKTLYQLPLNLKGKLICFGELHSMIPLLCAYLRYFYSDKLRIGYIMSDHAALPLSFSKIISQLKKIGLIDTTITIGNAFGGDYECVNIYSGLQTASMLEHCDIIIVSMGPGITGTGTRFGFSGLELGFYLDLAYRQRGQCCFVPRISFADKRDRHYGISHHTMTILKHIIESPIPLTLPILNKEKSQTLYRQLLKNRIIGKHQVCFSDGRGMLKALKHYNLNVTSMGRDMKDDPAFFEGVGAAVKMAMSIFYSRL